MVGKLRAEDYTKVLAPALAAPTEGGGKIRIVLRFTDEFEGMEPGAAVQDLRMGIRDWSAWERIALVTDHDWMREDWFEPDQSTYEARQRRPSLNERRHVRPGPRA